MKKLFIIPLFGAAIAFAAFTGKDIKVPLAAKQSFEKSHQGAKGKWDKEGANFEVNFKEGGKTMSCVITAGGTILETETDMAIDQLPASAKAYVNEHYKGARIKDASRIVKNTGEVIFEAGVGSKDVLFDQNGKFMKAVKG